MVRIISSTLYDVSSAGTEESASEPIWARPEPGARRPRLTREQLAATAMAIADSDGVDAVTMRRVAEELGAGTMTLYHYVRSKDELIALVIDHMMGELLMPAGEMPDDWRDAFNRHRPSLAGGVPQARLDPRGDGAGRPRRRSDRQQRPAPLRAVAPGGRPHRPAAEDQLEILSFVDDYVFGYSLREREEQLSGAYADEHAEAISGYIEEQLGTGEFPHVRALLGDRSPREFLRETLDRFLTEDRFERGLRRVLDGLALELERRQSPMK